MSVLPVGHAVRGATLPDRAGRVGALAETGLDLAIAGLCKTFDGRRPILDNVSLQVPQGQALALVGTNGAGSAWAFAGRL